MIDRRQFVLLSTASVLGRVGLSPFGKEGAPGMYGLIGRISATPGDRDELARILLDGIGGMPGCLSYVVALDVEDEDALWVTEVWDSEASHAASLSLPSVREAIRRGRPLIAGFGERVTTTPLGGHGLRSPA